MTHAPHSFGFRRKLRAIRLRCTEMVHRRMRSISVVKKSGFSCRLRNCDAHQPFSLWLVGNFWDTKEFAMKNALNHVYSATIVLGMAAAPAALIATPSFAHGEGGMSGIHGDFGGQSSSHMSVSGQTQ